MFFNSRTVVKALMMNHVSDFPLRWKLQKYEKQSMKIFVKKKTNRMNFYRVQFVALVKPDAPDINIYDASETRRLNLYQRPIPISKVISDTRVPLPARPRVNIGEKETAIFRIPPGPRKSRGLCKTVAKLSHVSPSSSTLWKDSRGAGRA